VHSGWRGTEALICARAVETLVARGSRPERLLAVVGPSIRRCCYTVSEELGARFSARFGAEVVAREGAEVRLDLARAVYDTLLGSGLGRAHVEVLPQCTACDAGQFFSHRREGGRTGRHLDFVMHCF
jgi:polyphenol oxidase